MLLRPLFFARMAFLLLAACSMAVAQTANTQPVLTGINLASGFFVGLNTSDSKANWISNDGSSLVMSFPGGTSQWGAVFFTYGPSVATNRPSLDMSQFSMLELDVSGPAGTSVLVGIKASTQGDSGLETKIPIQLTGAFKTYQIPLSSFTGADLRKIYVMAEFVWETSQAQVVKVRNIRYTGSAILATKILPQFAFGGGWYSALYLTNSGTTSVSFPVSFLTDTGTPLVIPSIGASTSTVTLAARATTVIEALNAGPLAQGYVSASLPDIVIGYGIFRQSTAGYPDQEAVVPISGNSTTTSILVFDDTNFLTAVAVANPSPENLTVNIALRDSSGQSIGTSSLSLPAGTKTAAFLRQIPGLSGIAGKRGSAEFSVGSGSIAVLGIRFNGLAFTSIPTNDK